MELKPGYEQTAVGVIPEDWEVCQLGDCLIGTPDYGINAPAVPYTDRLPVYIRITDITDDGRFSPEDVVSVEGADTDRHFLNVGDLVFARTGASVGKSYLYDHNDGRLVFAGYLIRVKPNLTRLDTHFLGAYVQTGRYWNWVRAMSTRSGQPGINATEYAQLPIPLPPLREQQTITTMLSDVDALITASDRLIAKKCAIKQATMQQLLTGKTRLPGFSGEWEVKRLGEIAEIGMGRTPSRTNQNYWGRGHKWMSIADLKSKYIYETKEQISDLAAAEMTVIPKGTRVMSVKLSIGRLAFTGCDMYSNEAICRLSKIKGDSAYFYYALSRTDFSLYGKQAVKGYTLNMESLSVVEVTCPSLEEQHAIAAVLSDMDAEIAALEQRRDKTRALKQGIMQELLTGRTRLI